MALVATRIHAFPDAARWARGLARDAGLSCAPVARHRFPDGESLVRVRRPAGRHAVLVCRLHDPDAKLVQTVLAADALRRAGARRLTLVAPYLPYMRQDAAFRPGEPVSQRVIGACLARAFDRVLTIEAHLHRTRRLGDVAGAGSRSLTAAPVLAAWVRRRGGRPLVVGPDEESEPWVRAIARLARVPWIVGRKRRAGDRAVDIRLPAHARTTRAVIVDDIAASGATVATTARALARRGVAVVDALLVHAIFAPGAMERMRAAGVRRIVSCDTVPHPTNALATGGLIAPLLARRPR